MPTNEAMYKFKGQKGENLVLNHMVNVAIFEHHMEESLTSLVTGNPPLWVTRHRSKIDGQTKTYINQAEILQSDIRARSRR